eukprot:CAMPEP_0182543804 /NCGR_PEP_ID=MMETSP1323-20130603/32185_1 /TAXON_ID=236787 /ORGANISM="Florenciella parvula, Strain RCC1693" /LENGTH=109 /DNA_ID=CAMNT_0024754773 /DNA_START=94 /DNA_END=419 /DNA_ORIENTATION=+
MTVELLDHKKAERPGEKAKCAPASENTLHNQTIAAVLGHFIARKLFTEYPLGHSQHVRREDHDGDEECLWHAVWVQQLDCLRNTMSRAMHAVGSGRRGYTEQSDHDGND